MTPEVLYNIRRITPHNIDRHLETIRYYASLCKHVTELGVERGWSTSALLASGAKTVRSYDVVRQPEVNLLEEAARIAGVDFRFILEDSRDAIIEPTDLLFVDTDHTYDQVDQELARHKDKVARFLVFHDIVSYPGIIPAITLHCSDEWRVLEWLEYQHGLAVLERKAL